MGELLKGKPVADAISLEVKYEVENLKAKGIVPKLMIVRVGERQDDISYEKAAIKRMQCCGIECEVKKLPLDISQNELIKIIRSINNDDTIHGILLFRPLPKHIDENVVSTIINTEKDVDCFNPLNFAKLAGDYNTEFAPCTPSAVLEILNFYDIKIKGKRAVIIGRSLVIGKPIALLLLSEDATVTICHSKSEDLKNISIDADILVVAIGRINMISKEFIKENAVIIDVGINVDSEGKICGDVNTDECIDKSSFITPVPGGVGSVTTAVLSKHVLKACKKINEIA